MVRRYDDIGWSIIAVRLCDKTFHFNDAVLWVDDRMAACGLRRQSDEIAKDAVAECVMGDLAQALMLIGRHSDNVKDQGSLRLGSHHAVQGRQLADAIGRHQHRRAANARKAVRSVSRIQLVGAADPLHLRAAVDGIADRKHVIAGDAK